MQTYFKTLRLIRPVANKWTRDSGAYFVSGGGGWGLTLEMPTCRVFWGSSQPTNFEILQLGNATFNILDENVDTVDTFHRTSKLDMPLTMLINFLDIIESLCSKEGILVFYVYTTPNWLTPNNIILRVQPLQFTSNC